MSRREEKFRPALSGKKFPILTLDQKWYRIFDQAEMSQDIVNYEAKLKELLKRQGKINTETKDIKKIKAKLMDEIVSMMDAIGEGEPDKKTAKKLEENRRLINECNEKLDGYQDEMLDLPREIDAVNYELMLYTMDACYDTLQENAKEIDKIGEWIAQIRRELKKKVVRKRKGIQHTADLCIYA